MEIAVQKLASVALFVIGLSHILRPKAWVRFFEYLASLGKAGSFVNAFIHLPLGALIISFHNVWNGIPLILTVLGYGWVIKSLFYFVFPEYGLKIMKRVSNEKSWQFVVAGCIMCGIGVLLIISILAEI